MFDSSTRDREQTARRLLRARERAGWTSAASFADANGIKRATYHHHENGRREITRESATSYERLLNLPIGSLLYGENLQTRKPISIVATIGFAGKVTPVRESDLGSIETIIPNVSELVGCAVVGDDMLPWAHHGDQIFYRPLSTDSFARFDLEALHGLECQVRLADGSEMLRTVSVQADGRVTLIGFNASTPPLLNQVIVAASPVEMVTRRLSDRLHNR
jgi:transcriptional regulator with XRE-family HTH domain